MKDRETMGSRISLALVDDEPTFLFEFSQRLRARGFDVFTFRDAASILEELGKRAMCDAIVADVRMPGLSGLELQERLVARHTPVPLILITGYADVEIAVSAMKAGAYDFLGKPVDEERLVRSIQTAVADNRRRVHELDEQRLLKERVSELSERHKQVLDLVVKGLTSKQIASQLNINHRTVENYRAFIMDRIGVGSIAQLVRVMMQFGPEVTPDQRRTDDP
jgi:two-component system response regulator FixJ